MKRRNFLIGLPIAIAAIKHKLLNQKPKVVDLGVLDIPDSSKIIVYKRSDKYPQTVYSGHAWFVDCETQVETITLKPADSSFINSVKFTSG